MSVVEIENELKKMTSLERQIVIEIAVKLAYGKHSQLKSFSPNTRMKRLNCSVSLESI